jgi:hypothetical protein
MKMKLFITGIIIKILLTTPLNETFSMSINPQNQIETFDFVDDNEISLNNDNLYQKHVRGNLRAGAGWVNLGIMPFATWHLSTGILIDEIPISINYIYGKEASGIFNIPEPLKEISASTITSGYCNYRSLFLYSVQFGVGYLNGINRGKIIENWKNVYLSEKIDLSSLCFHLNSEVGLHTGKFVASFAFDMLVTNKNKPISNFSINLGLIW